MTIEEQEESAMILGMAIHAGFSAKPRHPGRVIYHLRKLVKRIQAVNAKSSAFERGFISAEGIKDREWYKHLGVAPGKWLGLYTIDLFFSSFTKLSMFVFRLRCYHIPSVNRGNYV